MNVASLRAQCPRPRGRWPGFPARIFALALALAIGASSAPGPHAVRAQEPAAPEPVGLAPPSPPPFGLPFDLPPGPSTWLLGQLYGNTTGSFFLGDVWYAAGQGMHFGLDFPAPCGTPLVSIGDGVVLQADLLARGSGPHNLLVRYPVPGQPERQLIALYGHLRERPALAPGEAVLRGQRIALTGDPDLTCRSRPHLHLELRSADTRTAYNPIAWIDADWDALMLLGPFSDVSFTRDLDQPLRWVRPDAQPDIRFGGPRLNAYPRAWPADRADTRCVLAAC